MEARTMKTNGTANTGELLGQLSGKAVETMTVWAEANQRVLRELVDLSVGTAKEGLRLYAEFQQGGIEALTLVEGVDGAQKLFRLIEGNARALTRSAERLQASAEQAGKGIHETLAATVTRLKDSYSQN
jgi:hypothetical protein